MPQYNNLQEEELKLKRRDLLVPQDVRERKGSFFTPKIWVDLSQKYLADVLGENWQDEYYVWDCAAGTGNLLNGLTNKYNIWASTLDQQDVDVMKDRIKNGANLLENHVFQFDFLNDAFTKLPQPLQDIINDPEKRKKLVIYINPPYAEGDSRKGEGRSGVAISRTHLKYEHVMGYSKRELYIQFVVRIYNELPNSLLAAFSTLKIEQAPRFFEFRQHFLAKLLKLFLVPANTFDNVKGEFPIAFQVWNTGMKERILSITADVYNEVGASIGTKDIFTYDDLQVINDWTLTFIDENKRSIGTLVTVGNDFQHQRLVRITKPHQPWNHQYQWQINCENLIHSAIYLSVRLALQPTWLNDRDQFLYPRDGWQTDTEFQNNCLTFTLFSNTIQSAYGTNHWIPFTEEEVNAQSRFTSHFMTDFISGKLAKHQLPDQSTTSLRELDAEKSFVPTEPLVFSPEATAVFDAGRELWRYYHAQPNANPNASYYDIREHFQGRSVPGRGNSATSDQNLRKGRMNSRSEDAEYNRLLGNLKAAMEALRLKIVPKVYEYGFLIA